MCVCVCVCVCVRACEGGMEGEEGLLLPYFGADLLVVMVLQLLVLILPVHVRVLLLLC